MTTDELYGAIHATPFQPFALVLADGRRLEVKAPHLIGHPRGASTAAVWLEDERAFDLVDLSYITAHEPLEAIPTKESGKPENGGQSFTVDVKVSLQAIALPEEDGRYSVIVPALPGCFTQGDTIEQVQANIVEAAELWLKMTHDQNKQHAIKVVS